MNRIRISKIKIEIQKKESKINISKRRKINNTSDNT